MINNIIDKDDSDSDSEYKTVRNSNSLNIKIDCIWEAISKGIKNTELTTENRSIMIDINNDAVIFERTYNKNIQISNKIWLDNCLKEQKKCLNINNYNEEYKILMYQNFDIWIKECFYSSLKMWTRSKKSKLYKNNYSENILRLCEYYYDLLNLRIEEWLDFYWIKRSLSKNYLHDYDSYNYEIYICNDIKMWEIEWKKIRIRYRSIHFQYMSQSFMKFYRFCPLCDEKLDMIECKCQNNKCNILEVLFPILKKQWYAFRCLNKSSYKMFSSVIQQPFVNSNNETQNFLYKSIQDMDIFIIALAGNEYNVS